MVNIRTNGFKNAKWNIKTGHPTKKDNIDTRTYQSGHYPVFDSRGEYLGMIIKNSPARNDVPLFMGEFWINGSPTNLI